MPAYVQHPPSRNPNSGVCGVSAACRTVACQYLERLTATGQEDFDGILKRAGGVLESGQSHFTRSSGSGDLSKLRFVCVDEYQDFSGLFHGMLSRIRKLNPTMSLFCVGDDWQAINGFAGSDLRYFNKFEKYVGPAKQLFIGTNYRSTQIVVGQGNLLMSGRGPEAVASPGAQEGYAYIAHLDAFQATQIEENRHAKDRTTPAILRLVHRALDQGMDVALLGRRNNIPWYVKSKGSGLDDFLSHIKSHLSKEYRDRVVASTVHQFKGLEKSFVIVLDAVQQSFPLIHPNWIFSRIFGDTIETLVDEERRLFYVALTRAAKTVVFLTNKGEESVFLDLNLPPIPWEKLKPAPGLMPDVTIKIGNRLGLGIDPTLRLKDQLRACQFLWNTTGWSAWARVEPKQSFSLDKLKGELWAEGADGIEVRILDESDNIWQSYQIEKGVWHTLIPPYESP